MHIPYINTHIHTYIHTYIHPQCVQFAVLSHFEQNPLANLTITDDYDKAFKFLTNEKTLQHIAELPSVAAARNGSTPSV